MRCSSIGRLGAVLVGALTAVTLTGPPAGAKPLEGGTFDDVFQYQAEDFCEVDGLDVDVQGVATGRYSINLQAGVPFFRQNMRITQTYTNPETGLSVTETVTTVEKDLSVTDNGDGTVTLLVLNTGNATVRDGSGKAIARNPGQIRYELLFDFGGTPTDLSDDEFLGFLGLVKGSTGRSDDFCAAVVPALT